MESKVKFRRFFLMTVLFFGSLLLSVPGICAAPGPDARVQADVWAATRAGEATSVLILLEPQPDLSPARKILDKKARGQWVYETLRRAARSSQAPLVARLQRLGLSYRTFWIVNSVQVRVTRAQLVDLLQAPHVQRVILDKYYRLDVPKPDSSFSATAVSATEWGVNRVQAPWAWTQGFTGQGVVVAGQDTGYMWDHAALVRAYRGYDASDPSHPTHDYNWHDAIHAIDSHHSGTNPCGLDAAAPCDDHGHGTHTMGTMVGNDLDPGDAAWPAGAPHAVGVAPGAKWMACRNMERGWGTPATYIECFQWFVAPWPVGGDANTQGDPSKAPDVINNSWGCPLSEGCTGPEIEPALNAAVDAGIVVVTSAGNYGSSCGSVKDPPSIYPRSFAVGATASNDALASFSSRGPVIYQGQTVMKPDISGPGVGVTSAYYNGDYTSMSGTSMAGPHVAGVVALLLSAQPALRGRVEMIEAILTRTADPETSSQGCGGDAATAVPNNGFGWGIVNARSAIESLSQSATLTGVFSDTVSGSGVAGATVMLHPLGQPGVVLSTTVTSASGAYTFTALSWGEYELSVTKTDYHNESLSPIYAVGGKVTRQDGWLEARPYVLGDLHIGTAVSDVVLDWSHEDSLAQRYEVWRALDAPYFTPPGQGVKLADVTPGALGASLVYSDTASMLGNAAQNGYYLVLGVSAAGVRAQPAPRKAEFDFTLFPGQ